MLTKSQIIKKLNEIYAQKKLERQILIKRAYDFLMRDEEFCKIDKLYRQQVIKLSKSEEDRKILENLQKQKYEIANKYNIPLEKLENKYSCDKCKDSGSINGKPCSCFEKNLNLLQIKNCGVNFEEIPSFSDAILAKDTDLFEIFQKMEKWCKTITTTKVQNITLTGGTGVGKTFFANCMLKQLLTQNINCLYYTAFNFNNILLKYHTSLEKEKNEILEPLLNCEVLFIDDLGTEPMYNNVTAEYLFLVLNERLIAGRHTIVTTNLSLNELKERYGERLFSRIINKKTNVTLKLTGEDKRTLK